MNRRLVPAAVAAAALAVGCKTSELTVTDTNRPHRSFRFVYEASVDETPAGAERTRLWIPVPVDTTDQTIRNLDLRLTYDGGKLATYEAAEPRDLQKGRAGDSLSWVAHDVEGGFGRSLCIETPGRPVSVRLSYDVTRYRTAGGDGYGEDDPRAMLRTESMIPLDGKVAALAAGLKTPPDTMGSARVLYDHTLERMRYDKPDGGQWGRGDAEWACDSRYGNCTDFHSYFMGLARSKGIPARFVMGFPIPAGDDVEAPVGGYHCWAYFWDEERGWIPVDISEADKHPEKADFFFGTLDEDRFAVTGGRDLALDPMPEQGRLNFFVYPYAEVDGASWPKVSKAFRRVRIDG